MKASVLPSLTAVSSSSKRILAAMAELDELNSPADPAEPPRKVAPLMLATDSTVEVEPERSHGEFNSSQQPTNRLIPPISPPPLASCPSHDLAPTAVEQVQVSQIVTKQGRFHMTRTCVSSLCYDWLMFL